MAIKPADKEKANTIKSRNNLEQVPGIDTWMKNTNGGTSRKLEKGCLCLKLKEKRELWGE